MDYVQMYISWLNKVDKLTLLTSFSHKMASINGKNLIVGYLFSITQLFDKFLANYWIFYLFEQIRTMYICTYHDSIRRSCWRHLEVLTSLWSPSSGKKYNSDILQLYIGWLISVIFCLDASRLCWSSYVHLCMQWPKGFRSFSNFFKYIHS